MESPKSEDRESTTPFLLKLFYRTGTFHRPDEFASASALPHHLPIHTYMTTTLLELAHHIAGSEPTALPSPAIGTRLSFRLIYPDTSYASRLPQDQAPPARYLSKDLGSLVLGEGGPGIDTDALEDANGDTAMSGPEEPSAASKTLATAKFVVGDYLSVAVLPPNESTGAVVPAAAVETSQATRISTSALGSVAPPPRRVDNEFPIGPTRGRGRGGRFGRGEREREWDGGRRERDNGHNFPEGEWRRGERLPDSGPRGGRRGSRW